jgi:hypothetical protein
MGALAPVQAARKLKGVRGALAPVRKELLCHESVLKVLRQPRGRRETFSTGSWFEPVLKVSLLHRFVAQTGAKGPAYIYTHPPAISSIFFPAEGVRGVC